MLQPESPYELPWQRQQIRVPREDLSRFCRPEWDDAVAAVNDNNVLLTHADANIQGRKLAHLREWSAREVVRRAVDVTSELAGIPVEAQGAGFVVSGHQPSLFHPGVWVKNFAIHALAVQTSRIGLNLIIDNDTMPGVSIGVPEGTRQSPAITEIPFDRQQSPRPWEEAEIKDREVFRSFASRVTESMAKWDVQPLVGEIWPDAVEMMEKGKLLGWCLAAARHRLERRWGSANLELPMSRLCECDPFLWFASHLFAHAGRFREVHNHALLQFRSINRVRSRTHPVPELTRIGQWTETPFWIWSVGDSQRRRAYVRQIDREVELFDGRDVVARFPLSREMDACCAVEVLRELPGRGLRLRTRALTTTLFARLCLADSFVHGIGGAKYDEMTDRIIARFFGMPAPAFVTTSATVHLPIAAPFDVSGNDIARLKQQMRDLEFNSDRHLEASASGKLAEWVSEKSRLIDEQNGSRVSGLSRRQRRERAGKNRLRYQRMHEIETILSSETTELQQRIQNEIIQMQQRLDANTILANREFSFCLYPVNLLRRQCLNELISESVLQR